jgi:integrase/recombinase XerC
MSAFDPTQVLLSTATALGLSHEDLLHAAELMRGSTNGGSVSGVPTFAEFLPEVVAACTEKSLPTYHTHFKRLVSNFADRRLDEVTVNELTSLRDTTVSEAAMQKLESAKRTGRELRSYEHDAHGYGAGENAVRAYRFFFKVACRANHLDVNTAAQIDIPTRPEAPERPLTVSELEEVAMIWCTTGNDPELDSLLFEFHRKTAARREGGLNLRVGNLNLTRGAVTLNEKFGRAREVPLDIEFMRRLLDFSQRRGASGVADNVFRSKRHEPISRKRYGTIYDRLDSYTDWTEKLDLGVHWIRHTTLDDVRTVADSRVAAKFAGHSDASQGTIGLYTKVSFEELAAAFEAIFGPRFTSEVS